MKWIEEYLKIRYNKHQKDWDTVGVIAGDEGISKSTLALHCLDTWYRLKNGETKQSDIKHMCMGGDDFANDISDDVKDDMTVFDEAGELDSRRAMSKFNVMVTQAYKVIRADRIFTILVISDFWDLEPRFRNKRIKFLMYVYRRGRVAVWLKDRVRAICALNEARLIKTPFIVKPNFLDSFPIYKGVLAEKYQEQKDKKTKESRKKLKVMDTTTGEENKVRDYRSDIVERARKMGIKFKDIATFLDVTTETLYRDVRRKQSPNADNKESV